MERKNLVKSNKLDYFELSKTAFIKITEDRFIYSLSGIIDDYEFNIPLDSIYNASYVLPKLNKNKTGCNIFWAFLSVVSSDRDISRSEDFVTDIEYSSQKLVIEYLPVGKKWKKKYQISSPTLTKEVIYKIVRILKYRNSKVS